MCTSKVVQARRNNNFYGLRSGHLRANFDETVLSSPLGVSDYVRQQNLSRQKKSADTEDVFQSIGLCV